MSTQPRAIQQIRNVRNLVRLLEEERVDLAMQAMGGNVRAGIAANEKANMIERINACLQVRV